MSPEYELLQELIQEYEKMKSNLGEVWMIVMPELQALDEFIMSALTALGDAIVSVPEELRSAAEAWSDKDGSIAASLRTVAERIQGAPNGSGYLGITGWSGASYDAAGLLQRAISYALDSSVPALDSEYESNSTDRLWTSTDEINVEDWGEYQRFQFMSAILTEIADEFETGVAEFLSIALTETGVALAIATAVATGMGILSLAGLLVGLATHVLMGISLLMSFYDAVATMSASAYSGMASDTPNYGPEWANQGF